MHCMKCGAEINNSGVFCENCLAEMEKYPVKPDITVTIPQRKEIPVSKKKSRRQRILPPEEQLRRVKSKLRLAHLTLAVVFICFLLVAAMLLQFLQT